MLWIVLLVFGVIVLAFCGVVYAACLSWRKMGPGKRVAGLSLLTPHFLLIACIAFSLLSGRAPLGAPLGSPRWNALFFSDVLIVFILPVPALVGTVLALVLFINARRR